MEILRGTLGRLLSGGSGIACLFGIVLFFLPWVEVTCQDTRLVSQTGPELLLGECSVDDTLAGLSEMGEQKKENKDPAEDIQPEPVVAAYPVGMVVAGLLSLLMAIGVLRGRVASTFASLGALAALAPLVFGLAVGFSIEREMKASMEKEASKPSSGAATEPGGDASFDEAGEAIGQAVSKAFQVRHTTVFYLEGGLAILVLVMVTVAGGLTGDPPRSRRRSRRR